MDIWKELFGKIGLWVIPLMILAWMARELFQYRLKRDEISFSAIVEKRASEIQHLYSKLVEGEKLLNDLYYLYMPVGIAPPQVDPVKVIQSIRALRDLAAEQRILYPPEICSLIDSMCDRLANVASMLEMREIFIKSGGGGSEQEQQEMERDAITKLKDEIPIIRDKLESKFRNLLGVNN